MPVLRRVLFVSLFVLLVALSFASLWLPVVMTIGSFHSTWTGFPDWLFEILWGTSTLALSTSLVAASFWLIGLLKRRFWRQH